MLRLSRYRFRPALLGALLLCAAACLRAQIVHLKIPITVTDSAHHSATVYFGVDPFATYCIDPALGEFELPADRCGTEPLCVYFRDTRPDSAACLGNGLLLNLQAYHASSQLDTFAVAFSSLIYPITFHWPGTLRAYFDSLRIRDPITGNAVNVDMLAADSLVLTAPIVDRLLLFSRGPKGYLEGADDNRKPLPAGTALLRNYPNPFNPSTRIVFALARREEVTVTVYDLLGRAVAALVDGVLEPGEHTVEWRPGRIAGGVYFCRLVSRDGIFTRSLLFLP